MITTRWRDNKTKVFDDALTLLIDKIVDETRTGLVTRENWMIEKVFPDNKQITLFESTITYNIITFKFDKAIYTGEDDFTRYPQEGFVIAYEHDNVIKYIMSKNSEAQLLLRKMLSYTRKNEIIKNDIELSNDVFLWIINRVYYSNNTIDIQSSTLQEQILHLQSIKGFSGDTDDAQTKITASGESVMNIISTLAFLLESSHFNKIIIDLSYKEHDNITLILKDGTIEIAIKNYIGTYDNDDYWDKIAKLYLLCYIEILPFLLQEYASDRENESWNNEKYNKFILDVSDKITERVKHKQQEIGILENNG